MAVFNQSPAGQGSTLVNVSQLGLLTGGTVNSLTINTTFVDPVSRIYTLPPGGSSIDLNILSEGGGGGNPSPTTGQIWPSGFIYSFLGSSSSGTGTGSGGGGTGGTTTDPYIASVKLLMHMDGSNGSTIFTDSSSAARSVAVNGGTVSISTADSKFGGSSGDFTLGGRLATNTTSDFDFTSDFTVELWAKQTGTTGGFDTLLSGSTETQFMIRSGGANPGVFFGGSQFANTLSLSSNTWHHIAIVRSGSALTAYKDGVVVGTLTTGAYVSPSYLLIGDSSVFGRYFRGYIDEFRVTIGVARYTASFTPPTAAFPNV